MRISEMTDSREIAVTRPLPLLLRIFLASIGLFAIVAPAWEFRTVFLHPGWITLFFGAIVLGAWSVGVGFVAAAIYGEDQSWRLRDGEIEIRRSNLWRSWTTLVRAADIRETTIKESEWDSGPNSFCVVLRLVNNEAFETRGFEKRANAEKLEARLRATLHLD
jgi:hypothetical protein